MDIVEFDECSWGKNIVPRLWDFREFGDDMAQERRDDPSKQRL